MLTDRLSATFSALADPTRRAILARLVLGETSVGELAKPFDMSGPAISKHLKVLEGAGLITRGREAHGSDHVAARRIPRQADGLSVTKQPTVRLESIMKMSARMIMPCLWFDTEAEAAANHYAAIFQNSKVGNISRYGKQGQEVHG